MGRPLIQDIRIRMDGGDIISLWRNGPIDPEMANGLSPWLSMNRGLCVTTQVILRGWRQAG